MRTGGGPWGTVTGGHRGAAELLAFPTREMDLDWVEALERHPDNAPFVLQWPRSRHRAASVDRSTAHWTFRRPSGERVGFAILTPVRWPATNVELVRLVVDVKGRGYGRAALELIQDFVFGELEAHRLWLDVFDFNHRARALYERCGFVQEGILREAVPRDGCFLSLVVYARLAWERAA